MNNPTLSPSAPWVDKNIFDAIFRHGIGAIDQRFFERLADNKTANFPPHQIVQLSDDKYRLTLAVAGFGEDDLDIELHNDLLTISGRRQEQPSQEQAHVLYNGIAFRDFSRQFKVGEHVYVDSADLKNGLLEIALTRRIPEAMKPKKIAIGGSDAKAAMEIEDNDRAERKPRLRAAS